MSPRIRVPEHAGSRAQARELVQPLGPDLSGRDVVIDCANVRVTTPSFLDETVKLLLVERQAKLLRVLDAPERARHLIERSADNRGVADRVAVGARA